MYLFRAQIIDGKIEDYVTRNKQRDEYNVDRQWMPLSCSYTKY